MCDFVGLSPSLVRQLLSADTFSQSLPSRIVSTDQVTPVLPTTIRLKAPCACLQVEIVGWCADRLLQHRADLDGVDLRRDTALHLAAGAGNTLVCRALLDRGATVTLRVRTDIISISYIITIPLSTVLGIQHKPYHFTATILTYLRVPSTERLRA